MIKKDSSESPKNSLFSFLFVNYVILQYRCISFSFLFFHSFMSFFGTPSGSAPSLYALQQQGCHDAMDGMHEARLIAWISYSPQYSQAINNK